MIDLEQLGSRLARLRAFRGVTQSALGKRLGVTGAAVSRLESRSGSTWKLGTLVRYCEALEVDPVELLADRIPDGWPK